MHIYRLVADWSDVGLVALGFVFGYFVKKVDDWQSEHRNRKRLAAVLATEVESIRAIAEHSIKMNTPTITSAREALERDGSQIGAIGIDDADYPATVYTSNPSLMQTLGESAMLSLTELYRWVDYSRNAKRLNNECADDFMEISKATAASGIMSGNQKDIATYSAGTSIVFAAQYLKDQQKIFEIASAALQDLERIGKVSVRGRVSVSTGEPLTGSFPKR